MNQRWERNLPVINSIESKIEELLSGEHEIDEETQLVIDDYKREIDGLKRSFEELIKETRQDIKDMYLNEEDEGEWAVAWSGGKDSTTVAGLVIDVLEELPPELHKRKVHFVMSDTMVENPNLESYMRDQVEKLDAYIKKTTLPITVNLVHRPIEHSYFYLILGRGYFLPQNNGTGRWCTQRLKTMPQRNFLKEIKPSLNLTGVRLSESNRRKASIKKWTKDARANLKIGGDKRNPTFMVIVDFTIEDVWEYLQRERLSWTSTHSVRTLYREATGECGFTNPKGTERAASTSESCGARFGCWTCPVILKDKSTEAMSQHNDWMKPLSDYRMMQLKVFGAYIPKRPEGQKRKVRSYIINQSKLIGDEIKKIVKSGHKRNGNKYTDSKGVIHNDKGTFSVEARKFLFDELMKTQDEVNYIRVKNGMSKITLISDEEINFIKKMWEKDEKECPWLITNVNGLTMDDLRFQLQRLDELESDQPLLVDEIPEN